MAVTARIYFLRFLLCFVFHLLWGEIYCSRSFFCRLYPYRFWPLTPRYKKWPHIFVWIMPSENKYKLRRMWSTRRTSIALFSCHALLVLYMYIYIYKYIYIYTYISTKKEGLKSFRALQSWNIIGRRYIVHLRLQFLIQMNWYASGYRF